MCGNAHRERIEQTQRDRKKLAPALLSRKRPRALTFPLPIKPHRSWNPFKSFPQQTLDQSQSLLASLPYEIRQLIWLELLGGHLLHIARAPKRLLAIQCAENFGPELETRLHGCWGRTYNRKRLDPTPGFYDCPVEGHPAKPANLVALLQTCRMVYTETISILYEKNIFDLNHVDTLLYLPRSILSKRLEQIRVVNFTWDFKLAFDGPAPYGLATWREACDVLVTLTGLEEIVLHLNSFAYRRGVFELPWLDPLRRVKAAKRFDVFVGKYHKEICELKGQYEEIAKEKRYPFKLYFSKNV